MRFLDLRPDSSEGSCGGPGEDVGLAVERGDQTVDAVVSEDRCELRAAGRDFADRAVEIDVGNQPAFAVCDASCS